MIPRKKWEERTPDLSVEPLEKDDACVMAHFSRPEVQYIGSTSGCGCDFPHSVLENGEWLPSLFEESVESEREAIERINRERLVALFQSIGEQCIELYCCWSDFGEPRFREEISLQTILDPLFRFKEQGFYKVVVKSGTESD